MKQVLINKCNQKEICHRQSYVFCTGDKVLLKNACKMKFDQDAYVGPHTMTEVWKDRTVCASKVNVTDT